MQRIEVARVHWNLWPHNGLSQTLENYQNLYKATKTKRNGPIKFRFSLRKKTTTDHRVMNDLFNKQFTTPKPHTTDINFHLTLRNIKERSLDDAPTINIDEVELAIRKAKNSKAEGPDGITMIHLKHLGPIAHQHLTHVFSLSLSPSTIPSIWKQSRVIPLLKPRKSVNDSKSYRPISLLCPASKILEKCLLPILQHHLKCAPHQHGFRSRHLTVTELNELSTAIANGFNQRQSADRTLLVALDLSKAFETVWHNTLLTLLNNSSLPGALVRWLSTYMHGRQV